MGEFNEEFGNGVDDDADERGLPRFAEKPWRTFMRILLLAAACAAISTQALAGVVYEIDLVNSAQNGIVALEVARAGSDRFHRAPFVTSALAEGGESATVRIRADDGGCRRDLRVYLADGSVVTRGIDVCRRNIASAEASL